jgi:hypothetical protein
MQTLWGFIKWTGAASLSIFAAAVSSWGQPVSLARSSEVGQIERSSDCRAAGSFQNAARAPGKDAEHSKGS